MYANDPLFDLQRNLVDLRRAVHADPEVGLHLPRTQRRIVDALAGLPLEIIEGDALSSVTAVLRGSRPGPTVLLRGDMDALPMTELTDLPYASRVDNAMHSCGHDLHTAMLVGAAHILATRLDELAGDVVFMFQPGEEGCDGAGKMIGEGVLTASGSEPVAAYALHVLSSRLSAGVFAGKAGPILAGGDLLKVTVHGKGGHGAAPHLARNPIPVACAIVNGLQALVANARDPFDPAVLTVGSLHSGSAGNVVPAEAVLEGSLRWFDSGTRDILRDGFADICRSTAIAHGLAADPEIVEYVAATVNDPNEADFAASVVREVHGVARYQALEHALTAGEDFSRVLERVPGAFLLLGACPPEVDPRMAPDSHSPYAVFDDTCLAGGAALLAELAIRRLAAREVL